MRNLMLTGLLIALVYASCETKPVESEATKTETPAVKPVNDTQLFSCPMHPEVTGNKGDKCSKCGMELTAIARRDGDEATAPLYACPMHPEVTGTKDDKCSKCGMALTEPVRK